MNAGPGSTINASPIKTTVTPITAMISFLSLGSSLNPIASVTRETHFILVPRHDDDKRQCVDASILKIAQRFNAGMIASR
jgi:hypothetical protein